MSFDCSFSFGVSIHEMSLPLVDVTPKGCRIRAEVAGAATLCQAVGGLGICAGMVTTCFGLSLAKNYPITGSLTASAGVVGALASREVYVLGRNTSQAMTEDIAIRAIYASSAYKFVNAITKDTLVVGPVLGPVLVNALK